MICSFCLPFTLFSQFLYARDFSCFNQPILASAKPAEVPVKKSVWSRHTCKGMSAWKATCCKVLWTTPLCLTRVHARATSRKMMWARNLQFTGRGKEFEVTQWLCYHSVSLFISVAMDSPCVWYTDIYADMRSNNWMHAHVCVCVCALLNWRWPGLGSYQSCFCMFVAKNKIK